MAYAADPGGHFASDTHRRVLAYLSDPTDNYGWSTAALHNRIKPDGPTHFDKAPEEGQPARADELQALLDELVADGHAEFVGGAYRRTAAGHALLTGPIANEPDVNDPSQPVAINPFPATVISSGNAEAAA